MSDTEPTSVGQVSEVGVAPRRAVIDLPSIDLLVLRRLAITISATVVVILLLFSVFLFGASNLEHARAQSLLLDRFAELVPTGTLGLLDSPIAEGTPVALIEIPDLNLRQVVVEGSSPQDLKQAPGHMPITPLPGEASNSVLLGRHAAYGGPFGRLGNLRPGAQIVVTTGQGIFAYTVNAIVPIPRDDTSFSQPTQESTLTLVTSGGSSPWSDRLVLRATLEGQPIGIANRPVASASSSYLGTSGDPIGWFLAVFWAAVLTIAIVVSRRLYRVWSSLSAYLVTVPILLLLLWFTFENIARALPGTM